MVIVIVRICAATKAKIPTVVPTHKNNNINNDNVSCDPQHFERSKRSKKKVLLHDTHTIG